MTEPASRPVAAPPPAGLRWPAEWEPHAATWLSWPHNPDTWPGRLAGAEAAFVAMIAALHGREDIHVQVADVAMEDRARRCITAAGIDADRGLHFHLTPTDDAWVRDHGALFVVRGEGAARERVALDFRFDAWGGKYPPWDRDDAVAKCMARDAGLSCYSADFVLEGGSVDGNGAGAILTTESCLLNANRERGGRTREQMEVRLNEWLGAQCVLWLGDGIVGDDTDGHIDDVTRFIAEDVVVTAVEDDPSDENHRPLRDNLQRLRDMRLANGAPLRIVTLPMPPPLVVDGQRCPASHVNFYLANGVALVPTFDAPSDERALALLRECLPGREVLGIPSRDLVVGLGAVHCATQQEPR